MNEWLLLSIKSDIADSAMIAKLGNLVTSMNSRDSTKSDCCGSGAEKKLVGYNDDTAS